MVTELSPADEEELRAFLALDPVQNVFLLGTVDEHGICGKPGGPLVAFFGWRGAQGLGGIVFVGGGGRLVVPFLRDRSAAAELGAFLRECYPIRSAIGSREAVDALWSAYGGAEPRLFRPQRLFAITPDDMGPFIAPQLRQARESDLEKVVNASAAMQQEDLGIDPLQVDPEGFRRRVLDRIRAGRTWVLFEGDVLAFRADINAVSRWGAQIEGVWTNPICRRRGLGTLALGQLCRSQLSRLPRMTLHVNESNQAAVGLYKKVGFVSSQPFRLVAVE